MASGQPMSAAQRRKGRRLRSWWRHEQQSIAMALAEGVHHSAEAGGGRDRDVLRPTETEDPASGGAAGASGGGGRAAGDGSHGRLRGCQGSSPRGVVASWR